MGEPIKGTNDYRIKTDDAISKKLNGLVVNEDGSVTHDALKTNHSPQNNKKVWYIVLGSILFALIAVIVCYFINRNHYDYSCVKDISRSENNTFADDNIVQVEEHNSTAAMDNIEEKLRETTLKYFKNFNNQNSNLRKYSTSEWYDYCESSSNDDDWSEGTNKFYCISTEMVINLVTLKIMSINTDGRTVKVKADYSLYWNDSEEPMGECVWLVSFNNNDDTPKIKNIKLLSN